jgi:hypothetical protein
MTIFTIIFMAFIGYSLNTVKQNQVVEKETKSTALAEMGVSYLQAAVTDIYNKNRNSVNTDIKKMMETDPNRDDSYYIEQAMEMMKKNIKDELPVLEKCIEGDCNGDNYAKFKIDQVEYSITQDSTTLKGQLIISFVSIGEFKGDLSENKKLFTELYIDVNPKIRNPEIPGGGGISITLELPKFNLVTIPQGEDAKCRTLSCSKILVNSTAKDLLGVVGGLLPNDIKDILKNLSNIPDYLLTNTQKVERNLLLSLADNNNDLNNKTIFSTKDLILGGNLHGNMEDLEVHSEGLLTLDGNFNNNNGSNPSVNIKLETKDNLNVNGHLNLAGRPPEKSYLYVKKDLNVFGHVDLSNTNAYVEGLAKITVNDNGQEKGGPLSIGANCKVCIKTDLRVGSISIDPASKVYLGGNLYVDGKVDNTKIGVESNLNDEQFLEKCGIRTTLEIPYEWVQDINSNVDYKYE